MRPLRARYENGALLPAKPLPLKQGESVSIVVVRDSDRARWDLARLGAHRDEDASLAEAGLDAWADALDREDRA
jgi:predicted DNA-binding antitoxin AbrB/MazE fold protein